MGWVRRLQADRLLVLVYWDACLNWAGTMRRERYLKTTWEATRRHKA